MNNNNNIWVGTTALTNSTAADLDLLTPLLRRCPGCRLQASEHYHALEGVAWAKIAITLEPKNPPREY